MAGNPKPVVATGTYLVNIASLTVDPKTKRAKISNPRYDVEATFTTHIPVNYCDKNRQDRKVQDFTFQDPKTKKKITGSYDYSWGNKSVNGFIIGNGSGGYYIITSAVPGSSSSTIDGATLLDPSQAQYSYVYDHSKSWSSGNFFDLQLNGEHYYFHQDDDGTATDGSLEEQFTFNTCFLAGSLIRTPTGYRKVEDLKRGDAIICYDPLRGQTMPQLLTWVGRSQARVKPSLPLDMAGYPVRIRKDALADNVPSEDLLVTAEHCLFFEGRFVPARMLVNGRSIHFDQLDGADPTSYDIFHIETKKHSIIFANNAMTESYLDTGNRHQFMLPSNDNILDSSPEPHAMPEQQSWYHDAAAPLCTARDFVAPLHHDLLGRAETLGFSFQHPYRADTLSDDPSFHLVTDQGHILHEKRTSSGYRIFSVPLDTEHLILSSRTGRPCDVHGPFVDDRRQLGLLVGEILYFRGAESITIDTHLTSEKLEGWHPLENVPMRWTQGTARLPLPGRQPGGDNVETGLLAIKIMDGGPYPIATDHPLAKEPELMDHHVLSNVG